MGSLLSIVCASLIATVNSQPRLDPLSCGQTLTTLYPPEHPPMLGAPPPPADADGPNPIRPPLGLWNPDAAFLLDTSSLPPLPDSGSNGRFEYQVSTEFAGNEFPTRIYLFDSDDLMRVDEDNLLDVSSSGDGSECNVDGTEIRSTLPVDILYVITVECCGDADTCPQTLASDDRRNLTLSLQCKSLPAPSFTPITCGETLNGETKPREEGGVSYSGRANTNDALFEVTPPRDDTYTFSTCNANTAFHTFVHIYDDVRMARSQVLGEMKGERDTSCDAASGFGATVSLDLKGGTKYYVVVDGDSAEGGPEHGTFSLAVDCVDGASTGLSTSDQTLLFVVAGLVSIFVALWGASRCADGGEGIKSGASHGRILLVGLALVDFISDVAFAITRLAAADNDSGGGFPVPDLIGRLALAFVVVPVALNCVFVVRIMRREFKGDEFRQWFTEHSVVMTALVVLAITHIDVLTLLYAGVFPCIARGRMFSAPFTDLTIRRLYWYGIVGNLFEDVPQICLQVLTIVQDGSTNEVVLVVALSTSVLAVLFGVFRRMFFLMLFKAAADKQQSAEELEEESNTAAELELQGKKRRSRESPAERDEQLNSECSRSVASLEKGSDVAEENESARDHSKDGKRHRKKGSRRSDGSDVTPGVEGDGENAAVIGMASVDEIARRKSLVEESDSDTSGNMGGPQGGAISHETRVRNLSGSYMHRETREGSTTSTTEQTKRGRLEKRIDSRGDHDHVASAGGSVSVVGPTSVEASQRRDGKGKLRQLTSFKRRGDDPGDPAAVTVLGRIDSDSSDDEGRGERTPIPNRGGPGDAEINYDPRSNRARRDASRSISQPQKRRRSALANSVNKFEDDDDDAESLTDYDPAHVPANSASAQTVAGSDGGQPATHGGVIDSQSSSSPARTRRASKSVDSHSSTESASEKSLSSAKSLSGSMSLSNSRSLSDAAKSLSSSRSLSLKEVDGDEDAAVVVLHADFASVPMNPEESVGIESVDTYDRDLFPHAHNRVATEAEADAEACCNDNDTDNSISSDDLS